ncbi:Rpn family recombination-promoting nuclease/putative transposase [Stutzerimonas kirkiae]|uniref:Rpn family recombination-promoting nuclease/putative transposase n=1 Tax=Stutzerimonas kirkiae TaxID=2211392 RepID=UPI00103830EE|nr:Rpn family recombination-promoting nuclease/putative transposase [Stutzerimonas kirkiae]TBV10871.1 transposase [Stutzerimonas kirkiae]
MAHTHDSGYKLLFSNPAFIRDLLLGFVPHEWVRQLDFATLEPLNGHYVSEDMRQRHEDMVWRVRLRGDWLHIYLLLEFQSTPDRFMVLRLLSYIGLFWQQLEKQGQLTDDKRLPPVLPLVLYNGEQEWPYPTELAALCHPPPKDLRSFQPQDYLLIDESRYEEEQLAGQRNLVATLMRLEHARDVQSLQAIIEELLTWLRLDDQTALRRNLAQWIVRLIRRRVPRGEVPELTDLLEVNTMLARRDIDWGAKWKQQGREEGQAALLLRQLSKRFGPLPEWAVQRVARAGGQRIGQWAEAIFDAQDLEELLGTADDGA